MSTNATAAANARLAITTAKPAVDTERGHQVRLFLGYLIAIALVAGIFAYGFNYYTLSSTERPFSPKHVLLKPSGVIGVKLGMLGLGMFLCIFLYPLRKRWAWLGRQGSSRHWMDNHVLLGLAAPFTRRSSSVALPASRFGSCSPFPSAESSDAISTGRFQEA
jgi:hypothetical protein